MLKRNTDITVGSLTKNVTTDAIRSKPAEASLLTYVCTAVIAARTVVVSEGKIYETTSRSPDNMRWWYKLVI